MGSEIDQLGAGTAEVGATDSCRVDWISNSYFAATGSLQRSQIAFFAELNHLLSGTYVLSPGGGRRFFEESWYHECGIALKWTEPDGDGVNRGLLSVDIKGDALAALPADVRKALYLDMQEIEGFKQMVSYVRIIEKAMGSGEKIILEEEKKIRKKLAPIK